MVQAYSSIGFANCYNLVLTLTSLHLLRSSATMTPENKWIWLRVNKTVWHFCRRPSHFRPMVTRFTVRKFIRQSVSRVRAMAS